MNSNRLGMHREHWQDWCNLILGLWLFFSPGVLRFGGIVPMNASEITAPIWDAWLLGIVVFLVSFIALFRDEVWPEWVNLALGAWIFIAPWILGFAAGSPKAARDHWIVGAIIAILGVWNATSSIRPNSPDARA